MTDYLDSRWFHCLLSRYIRRPLPPIPVDPHLQQNGGPCPPPYTTTGGHHMNVNRAFSPDTGKYTTTTLPEDQNKDIKGPTKRTNVLQNRKIGIDKLQWALCASKLWIFRKYIYISIPFQCLHSKCLTHFRSSGSCDGRWDSGATPAPAAGGEHVLPADHWAPSGRATAAVRRHQQGPRHPLVGRRHGRPSRYTVHSATGSAV